MAIFHFAKPSFLLSPGSASQCQGWNFQRSCSPADDVGATKTKVVGTNGQMDEMGEKWMKNG